MLPRLICLILEIDVVIIAIVLAIVPVVLFVLTPQGDLPLNFLWGQSITEHFRDLFVVLGSLLGALDGGYGGLGT
jgi:uncharacterized RDD family membrane protein YckC